MRNLIVLLTIVAVLLCPYQCTVKASAAHASVSVPSPACCDECAAEQETAPAQNDPPAAPAHDRDGRCCVCQGAIFDAGARPTVNDTQPAFFLAWLAPVAEPTDIATAATPALRSDQPSGEYGQSLRIALGSLLL